ncbi:MAG TPA: carboxypeptidase-like regulatory domain-containing protein [Candidatus Polarisedimenticolia bacterium]|nr:carboxypeptidase-like regulatory domain-containing protein [Candidatus Polarisedimenticolia bacterium]
MMPVAALALMLWPLALAAPPTVQELPPPPAAPRTAGPAAGQINGAVNDVRQKGVAGLSVAVIPQAGTTIYGTNTDEAGRYAFKGLKAGTYSVIVRQAGGGIARKDGLKVRPLFRSIVDFTLPTDFGATDIPPAGVAQDGASEGEAAAALSLECLLQGRDRAPTPDASMVLTPLDDAGKPGRARTDGDGKCVLEMFPPGRYRLAARSAGYMSWTMEPMTLRGAAALELTLSLVPFPMGFEGTLEDLLITVDPIPPSPPAAAEAPKR